MSAPVSTHASNKEAKEVKEPQESIKLTSSGSSATDLVDLESNDEVLSRKMKLVNNTIDEIGFTPYHVKLFFLNGMGYATDSQLLMVESSVRSFVNAQFGYSFPISNEAVVIGGIVGAIFWGFGADLIGRRTAFNFSLFLSAVFTILSGAMSNMATYCLFVALASFAFGGNLVLDTCVFLEFLPFKHQWLLTFFAFFWGIGQTVAVLLAWAFLANFSCDGTTPSTCDSADNRGWRYTFYVNGAIVLVLAVLRVTVVKLQETPKFLISNNRDEECYENLRKLAEKYNRPFTLSLERLTECGSITSNNDYRQNVSILNTFALVRKHLAVLFATPKMMRSTILLLLSWLLLGICYPIYYAFLPVYLATRGENISASSTSGVYRDNAISNACSILGPVVAGILLYYVPILGRRGVLAIGAFCTMALFFGYTGIQNHAQNVGLSSAAYVALYIYFGCLYAYSPEILPSSARATGNACFIMTTRFGQIFAPIIAHYSDTSSSAPLYVCGALIGCNAVISLLLPFEPTKQRPA